MKNNPLNAICLMFAAAMALNSGSVFSAFAQEKSEPKSMRVKIVKEIDGQTVILDTVFVPGSAEYESFQKRITDFSPMREPAQIPICRGQQFRDINIEKRTLPEGSTYQKRITVNDSSRVFEFRKFIDAGLDREQLSEFLKKHEELQQMRIEKDGDLLLKMHDLGKAMPPGEIEKLLKEKGIENGRIFINQEKAGKHSFISLDSTLAKIYLDKAVVFNNCNSKQNTVVIVKVSCLDNEEAKMLENTNEDLPASKKELGLDEFALYPNPADGRFTLKFAHWAQGLTSIRIYDEVGRLVYSEDLRDQDGLYSKEIDLSGSPKGVYFVRINQGESGFSRKIVLQ